VLRAHTGIKQDKLTNGKGKKSHQEAKPAWENKSLGFNEAVHLWL